ncbi:MAG: FxsA family protein, partial [Oscillospiraceae bacterium]|nr:FxsA family protein [Oscillospiraceae bacterium]
FIDTTVGEVVLNSITALFGIFGVASCLSGYVFAPVKWPLRLMLLVGGLALLIPGLVTDVIGIALIAVALITSFIEKKAANKLA